MGTPDASADAPPPRSFLRSVFSHGTTYAFGSLVTQAIGILLFPFYAHVFSPHEYGILDILALVGTLVNMTVGLGVAAGMGRYFVDARELDEKRTLASTALLFTLLTYTTAAALAYALIRPLTEVLLGDGSPLSLTAVAFAGMWCGGILSLGQFVLQYQFRPKSYTAVSVVTAAVGGATTVLLVLGFGVGVIGAFVGQITGAVAGGVIAFTLGRRLYRPRFDRGRLAKMLAYSVPLIPASIGSFLNAYADRIAIRTRLTLTDVGIYGAGYRFSLVVSIVLVGFQGALIPLVLSRHEEPETRTGLADTLRYFTAIALLIFLLVSLFADELLRLLTAPGYYGGAKVVPFVVAGAFLAGMYPFAPGLSIVRRTRLLGAIIAVTGFLNLGLAFALVGPLGVRGPAVAFLVACAAGFAAVMAVSQRVYAVPHEWPRLARVTIVVAGIVTFGRIAFGGQVDLRSVLAELGLIAIGVVAISTLAPRRDPVARWQRRRR